MALLYAPNRSHHVMIEQTLERTHEGRTALDGNVARNRDNWFTVTTFRYIPPSCLSEYDTRYDQGLEHLLYIQTLIDEDIDEAA
jgi:hypothetical protein